MEKKKKKERNRNITSCLFMSKDRPQAWLYLWIQLQLARNRTEHVRPQRLYATSTVHRQVSESNGPGSKVDYKEKKKRKREPVDWGSESPTRSLQMSKVKRWCPGTLWGDKAAQDPLVQGCGWGRAGWLASQLAARVLGLGLSLGYKSLPYKNILSYI